MKYRELGKTGMKVSEVGFGASSLGGVFHSFNENRGIDAVFAAVDAGINIIDVSPYYGYYKAEIVLGKALKDIPRDKFFLSTKVGRYGEDGHNTWDYSARRAKESVYESLERLHIDYIDIINVHDIEFQGRLEGGLQKVVDETLPALRVIEHTEPGTVESVMNFCHYCLCDDKLADFLDFFEENHIGVLSASPFSMGLLTERGVPEWHPAPKPLVEACRRAAEHCKAKNYPIEKLAMQFACSNPRIATTVFSTTRPDAIKTNLAYIAEPMDEQLVQEVREIIGDQQRVSWANT